MNKRFIWFLMLNKRLYKKAAFVIMLILIPVSVFVFSLVSGQDSGFLHIVLARTDSSDEVSSQVVNELLGEESIINFTKAESPEQALDAVKTGKADEAWIFPADMQGKINEFVTSDADGFVTVVSREQTVLLRIAHEKLTAALYKYCAKAHYIDFARTNASSLNSMTYEELIRYFDDTAIDEELFVFGNPDISALPDSTQENNYLTSPIRGMLSILVVIGGMAAALYYMQDERSGTFSWVRESNRIFVAFACMVIATLNVSAAMLISLFAAGLAGTVLKELLSVVLYSLCCAVFCMLLWQIFGSIKLYGAVIPLFTVIMIAVCPVFFDFRILLGIQLIFPPTYYVNAVYDNRYLLYMAAYTVVGLVLCRLLQRLKKVKLNKR